MRMVTFLFDREQSGRHSCARLEAHSPVHNYGQHPPIALS